MGALLFHNTLGALGVVGTFNRRKVLSKPLAHSKRSVNGGLHYKPESISLLVRRSPSKQEVVGWATGLWLTLSSPGGPAPGLLAAPWAEPAVLTHSSQRAAN